MSTKKRILILENSTHVTGALKSIVRTSYDLRSDFDFVFVIPTGSKGRYLIERFGFLNVYELPLKELGRKLLLILLYLPYLIANTVRVHRLLKKEHVDIIHSNDLYNLIPVVYKIFGGSVPYVCHIRFLPGGFPRYLFNFWFRLHKRFASRIVVVSQYLKAQLPVNSKVEYIPNELPIDEIYPAASDEIEKQSYTFLYLSNYIPGKGQDFALEAFARIAPMLPFWRLRFIGGDMGLKKNWLYKQQLMQKAITRGVYDRIEWGDFAKDTEFEYKKADIVLNFSESESFSITCLEALFWGRPLIATDCGGPAEIVDHNETGLLVSNRDVDAMTKAMYRLATDRHLRVALSCRGRIVSRDRFSLEKTSMKMSQVYLDVVNKN
ncbi:MAG: glycosyltransferase family 4 protein [Cyclobacteriaceae bacterium]|nr:glycosyltransferase family 4 protein [Cyclobacteriaceae bacterium]